MDYLVFNDTTGEFCAADQVVGVLNSQDGSLIYTGCIPPFPSPLKPRELLRRLTIIRFKRENTTSTRTFQERLPVPAVTAGHRAVADD